uniref:RNA-directed DNA polymerase n=1 Tax=Sipha flava TaxID=143950 RepID=A0A2S2PVB5_9HEMI
MFERFRQFNLKLQPLKFEFLRKEVAYLEHIITDRSVQLDPKTTNCVVQFPVSKEAKEVKYFFGLAVYYRCFIQNFSQIVKSLTNLLKKDTIFLWTGHCQNSFEELKRLLSQIPILQYSETSRPLVVMTDAIGAVLSQGKIGADLSITYISHTLSKAEKNYNTTEKELLAIIWAIKQFRPYIFGQQFTVITDHKLLTWLFTLKEPIARILT